MRVNRTLALAGGLTALTALAAPALADGVFEQITPGTANINITGIPEGGTVMVVTDQIQAGSQTMVISRDGGAMASAGGNAYATEVERSDSWQPGMAHDSDGTYYTIRPEAPAQTAGSPSTPTQVVQSDTWRPGYLRSDDGSYYMLAPERSTLTTSSEVSVMVDPTWSSAMEVSTASDDSGVGNSSTFIERSDTWRPGFAHDGGGWYERIVHLRDSVPAETLPDFR